MGDAFEEGRNPVKTAIFSVLAAAVLLLCMAGAGGDISLQSPGSPVIRIIDGDTVEMVIEGNPVRVRYLLVDSPELHHPGRPVEELGEEARRLNGRLLGKGTIRLEFDEEHHDRYGRLLAYVWAGSGDGESFVNEEMVRQGLAVPLVIPPNGRYAPKVYDAFRKAKEDGAGLWGRAEKRFFTSAQLWSEAPYLAGSFVTLCMRIEKKEKQGKRLLFREGRTALAFYRDGETESLLDLEPGHRILAVGKVLLSRNGCEMPIASPSQIRRLPDQDFFLNY